MPTSPPPIPRPIAGRFSIHGRSIPLALCHWHVPAADSPIAARWRGLVGEAPFFHVQQVGPRPTFLGVAAFDPDEGRSFALELVCGGWAWPELKRRDTLMILDATGRVRAFSGRSVRPAPALEAMAHQQVCPASRLALQRARDEAARREDLVRHLLPLLPPHLGLSAGDLASGKAGSVAAQERHNAQVWVVGSLEPREAWDLATELASSPLWQPAAHGHLVVQIGDSALTVRLEHPDPGAAQELAALVKGFCRRVVIADLHLGRRDRDTFGQAKLPPLLDLLDSIIAQRSLLILNGDFLELLHERYGVIKRSYPEIFARLARVRRIIYVAGNHDADILGESIKETRRACRKVAQRHAFAEVSLGLCDEILLSPCPGHGPVPHARSWMCVLRDPRLQSRLADLLRDRRGAVYLSRGFASEGVAFKRNGPRGTPAEKPLWHFDEDILSRPDPAGELLRLMADRRQRLDRVIQADWGGHVEFVRYHWDPCAGLYFEHGHFAVPSCHGSPWGRRVSVAAGWAKRLGWCGVEDHFEERLGGWLRALYPFDTIRTCRHFINRTLAVGTAFAALANRGPHFTIVCSHTHEPACHGAGPVHHFLHALTGGSYANTGAWSSRLRRQQRGDSSAEWIEIGLAAQLELQRVEVSSPALAGWRQAEPPSLPALVAG